MESGPSPVRYYLPACLAKSTPCHPVCELFPGRLHAIHPPPPQTRSPMSALMGMLRCALDGSPSPRYHHRHFGDPAAPSP